MVELSHSDIKQIQRTHKQRGSAKRVNVLIVLVIVAVVGSVLAFNFTTLPDRLKNLFYKAEPEITAIAEKVKLTDKGNTVFLAARPALEEATDFNEHCDSHNAEISVLGCYANGQIFLYNIQNKDLDGIVESTAAHELLHAVWERMHSWDRASLEASLLSVYQEYQEQLGAGLENYASEDLLDELHSRIGTEIANLPDDLEAHYAQYFQNQNNVVALYNKYAKKFTELTEQSDDLLSQIEQKTGAIDQRTAAYYAAVEELTQRIDKFNRCAETQGCFSSTSEFNQQRAEILAEQASLEEEYNDLNAEISAYNQLVNQYNSLVIKTQKLENTINSNALPELEGLEVDND